MPRGSHQPAPLKAYNPLVEGLLEAKAYPHPVRDLHLRQTHVSWLFFTGDYVYKIKKPVDFRFLDFTTLEKRLHFCRREVMLNNRISPRVYLGVVPITRKGRRFRVMGRGEVADYAVRMHQLPEERTLASLIKLGELQPNQLLQVARRIAAFHREAATGPEVVGHGDLAAVRFNVEENFEQTHEFVNGLFEAAAFDDVVAFSRAFMAVRAPLFEQRAGQGRIREGHGDLHAGNIFLTDGIQIIDCIEFNDRFRCLDVAEDIAFLAMDLDHFGRQDLSRAFVEAYIETSGDEGIRELLDFFKVYRAYVRAKVSALVFRDSELEDAQRLEMESRAKSYFGLAHFYTNRVWNRPRLIVMSGLMGSGKTTVAEELARRWALKHVSSDLVRKRLAGVPASEHRYEEYGQGIYSKDFSQRTYASMREEASRLLSRGRSVVLDASFQNRRERQLVRLLAQEKEADLFFFECRASDEILRKRLEERLLDAQQTVSDGRSAILEKQKAAWQPFRNARFLIRLNTEAPVAETIRSLIEALYARKLGSQITSRILVPPISP